MQTILSLSSSQHPDKPVVAGKPKPSEWDLQPVPEAEPQPSFQAKRTGAKEYSNPGGPKQAPNASGTTRAIEWTLNILLLLASSLFVIAWYMQDRLPKPDEMLPELAQSPVQTPLEDTSFQFNYRNHDYEVKTFAEYELWGVIVSHNNISGVGDIYHNSDSLDTKDICVLWGGNVAQDDYLRVSFSSGAWTCYYQYPEGVSFNTSEISNNHLITDSPKIRKQIEGLRIGDQVRMRGRLVGYRDIQWTNFWRNSSLVRTDTGNGACEVVFVEEIDVLKPGNAPWRKAGLTSGWAALILLAIRLIYLFGELFKPADERLSGFTWRNRK
jgi:hypothetical protein